MSAFELCVSFWCVNILCLFWISNCSLSPAQRFLRTKTDMATPHSNSVNHGDNPVTVICSNCNERIVSRVESRSGRMTCLGVICLILCAICSASDLSAPMQSCFDELQATHHNCLNCDAELGVFRML